jgi:peptide/nickel transport system permease protein
MRYLLRRFAHVVFLLLGVSILSFVFLSMAPGSFLDEMRLDPSVASETVAALRAEYGLDRPVSVRYERWLKALVHGDLGYSFAYNQPATSLLWPRARHTLLLTSIATTVAWLLALPIGIWSAEREGGFGDHLVSAASGTFLALPDLLVVIGLLFIAVKTNWVPTGGMTSADFDAYDASGRLLDLTAHLVLPVTALVLITLPILIRNVRDAMARALRAPFLLAAAGHGISRPRLLLRYALPVAANPLISVFGFSVGALLSCSLLVEIILGWPGLGPLLLEAILARDIFLVIGAIMFSTIFLVGGNLLAELLLYCNDPRIRIE